MGQRKKVWWREDRGGWYTTVNGKQTLLHPTDRAEADRKLHELQAKQKAPDLQDCNSLKTIFELYLDFITSEHATSYKSHKFYLQSFLDFHPALRVKDLTATQVRRWLHSKTTWGDTTKCHGLSILLAALSWAAKPEQRLISHNPVEGMKRPPAKSRGAEVVIPPETYQQLLDGASPELRDVLVLLAQTGMRPGNVCNITAADCDFANGVLVLKQHKTLKKTGKPIYVPMTDVLREVLERLAKRHPKGVLFRTSRGVKWTAVNIWERLKGLQERLGLEGRIIPYGFRHTVATTLLEKDVPPPKIAAILGQTNTAMLYRHYGHLMTGGLKTDLEKLNEGE